jgi:hypothetical protein
MPGFHEADILPIDFRILDGLEAGLPVPLFSATPYRA